MSVVERVNSAVVVAAAQAVFTLDRGPVMAGDLAGLRGFTVLSYDFALCRYAAAEAAAHAGLEGSGLIVTAAGDDFVLIDGQPLRLADSSQTTVSKLTVDARLFGVTVDEDEAGELRVHLRDGLKGKSRPSELKALAPVIADGVRTPTGIKSDREVSAVGQPTPAATITITGPQNLIIWPDRKPVGMGVLVGA